MKDRIALKASLASALCACLLALFAVTAPAYAEEITSTEGDAAAKSAAVDPETPESSGSLTGAKDQLAAPNAPTGKTEENPSESSTKPGSSNNAKADAGSSSGSATTKAPSSSAEDPEAKEPSLSGTAHVQDKGTVKAAAKSDGKLSLGTTGQGKRLEGISVKDDNHEVNVSYAAHVQNIGWQAEKKNGSFAGTTGKSLQMEAVWMKVDKAGYAIWYRAHVANNGWLGWASNGQKAGSEGLSKQMEALEVLVLPNGQLPPGYNPNLAAFLQKVINYTSHVQDIGNRSGYTLSLGDTVTIGTTGKGKHLEGFSVKLNGVSGGISYNAHVQNIGWQGNKANGAFAGTKGQSKQVEAAKMTLSGSLAKDYDIYYRAHVANIGWMGWLKNGGSVGTAGFSVPVEALQFIILPKNSSKAPSTKEIAYIDSSKMPSMVYESKSKGQGWGSTGTGKVAGTTGQGLALIGVGMKATASNSVSGGITYLAHFANAGWTSWCSNGTRDTNASNSVQALKVKLTGNLSKYFDVYYRSHVSGYGWMGWAKNGAASGTTGLNMNAEAYQVKLVVKGSAAPGSTAKSFSDQNGFLGVPPEQKAMLNRIRSYGSGTGYLIAVDRSTHKVGVFTGGAGSWNMKYYWSCVTGAPSTPTITGSYSTTGGKRPALTTDSRAKYATQISGGYFFHTILNSEAELGQSLSHGCIRMAYSSAQWIYNNIFGGTRVVIYN